MKPDFDYNTVPYNFAHCLNEQCPQASACLRQLVTRRIPLSKKTFTIINPAVPDPTGKHCCYFLPDQLQQFVKGISHLYDKLPYKEALLIKEQLISHFGRTAYYRFKRKERYINPADQQYIRQLFLSKGFTDEPQYDEYTELYEWQVPAAER